MRVMDVPVWDVPGGLDGWMDGWILSVLSVY